VIWILIIPNSAVPNFHLKFTARRYAERGKLSAHDVEVSWSQVGILHK